MPAPTPDRHTELPVVTMPSRILLVDENEMVLRSLEAVLNRSGFQVTIASDANHAILLIEWQEFDILLSGLHLPRAADGLSVLRAMRHANPRTITMIFSAYPEMETTAAVLHLHADEVITKPMPPVALLQRINERLQLGPRAYMKVSQRA